MFPCNKLATPTTKETGNHRIPRTHSQVLFQEARNLVFSSANQMHRGWPQTKRAKPKGGTTTPDKMPNSHPEMSVHILKISDRIKDNISPSTLTCSTLMVSVCICSPSTLHPSSLFRDKFSLEVFQLLGEPLNLLHRHSLPLCFN